MAERIAHAIEYCAPAAAEASDGCRYVHRWVNGAALWRLPHTEVASDARRGETPSLPAIQARARNLQGAVSDLRHMAFAMRAVYDADMARIGAALAVAAGRATRAQITVAEARAELAEAASETDELRDQLAVEQTTRAAAQRAVQAVGAAGGGLRATDRAIDEARLAEAAADADARAKAAVAREETARAEAARLVSALEAAEGALRAARAQCERSEAEARPSPPPAMTPSPPHAHLPRVQRPFAGARAQGFDPRRLSPASACHFGGPRAFRRLRPSLGDGTRAAGPCLPPTALSRVQPDARPTQVLLTPSDGAPARAFDFDRVFSPSDADDAVFDEAASSPTHHHRHHRRPFPRHAHWILTVWRPAQIEPLVESAATGGRAALLAYGQTGSGKTYTLSRIHHRIVSKLINAADASGAEGRCEKDEGKGGDNGRGWRLTLGAVEVYNERARDVLIDGPDANLGGISAQSPSVEINHAGLVDGLTRREVRTPRSHEAPPRDAPSPLGECPEDPSCRFAAPTRPMRSRRQRSARARRRRLR